MGEDDAGIELEATAPIDVSGAAEGNADTVAAALPANALELGATLAAGSVVPSSGRATSERPGEQEPDDAMADTQLGALARGSAAPTARSEARELRTTAPRRAELALYAVALGASVHTLFFLLRFVLGDTPPQLHPAFLGGQPAAEGAFLSSGVFHGPFLTLLRTTSIALLFIPVALWVARRNRDNALAQLLSAVAIAASQLSIAIAVLTSTESNDAWRLISAAWHMVMPTAAFTLLCYYPSGRAVPGWSRFLLAPALLPFAVQTGNMYLYRDYSVAVSLSGLAFALLFLFFQRHRYRHHATAREQRQIKWIGYAGTAFLTIQLVAIAGVLPLLKDVNRPGFQFLKLVYEFLLLASYLVALVSTLSSAARYRLWDIDRVINRTLVYGLATVLLAAAFAVVFFASDALLRGLFSAPGLLSAAISFALVALAFAPLRRRISRFIDRRIYGIGLDYEALAARAIEASALPTTNSEFGGYDELALLGRGGMGAVYRAHHADYGVPVALKVMSPALADDKSAQERFRLEAELLEELQHPNIVPYLNSGHDEGLAFIAMQYLEGEDLGELLQRKRRLSPHEALPILEDIAAGLDAVHAKGVVHRDIKPANILLEGEERDALAGRRAQLMDFGVACRESSTVAEEGLVGSLPYLSPEQIQQPNAVDRKADIYALGATAYELLTGRPPFVESSPLGFVMAHLKRPPEDPRRLVPSLSEGIAETLLVALAKEPADRYGSAGEFVDALAAGTR